MVTRVRQGATPSPQCLGRTSHATLQIPPGRLSPSVSFASREDCQDLPGGAASFFSFSFL